MTIPEQQRPRPATWRIVLAAILDFLTAFIVLGFVVASLTGGRTQGGFQLNGWPALLLFALIIAYFVVFNKFLGGTIWKWILGARR
jgi:Na+/melibiose symporter-like transporter